MVCSLLSVRYGTVEMTIIIIIISGISTQFCLGDVFFAAVASCVCIHKIPDL